MVLKRFCYKQGQYNENLSVFFWPSLTHFIILYHEENRKTYKRNRIYFRGPALQNVSNIVGNMPNL